MGRVLTGALEGATSTGAVGVGAVVGLRLVTISPAVPLESVMGGGETKPPRDVVGGGSWFVSEGVLGTADVEGINICPVSFGDVVSDSSSSISPEGGPALVQENAVALSAAVYPNLRKDDSCTIYM